MKISILDELASFYKRRIDIPVGPNDIVLDIGSGDKPHWRSDILVDQFISDTDGIQRSGSSSVMVSRPLVVANIEKMPFKDKSFDFIICSHVLEHVIHPDKAIQEIMRVGKAGYIEVPFEGSSKIADVPSHLWYCRMEKGTLIFTAKKSVAFDKVIDSLMSSRDVLYAFAALGQHYWDKFIVSYRWKNAVKFKVIGNASKKLFVDAKKAEVIHNKGNFFLRNIVNFFIPVIFWQKKNSRKIDIISLMRCNYCGGDMEERKSNVFCASCKKQVQVLW